MNLIVNKAKNSGMFLFVNGGLNFNDYQMNIHIDRSKAATLGININDITNDLNTLLSGNNVNYFSIDNYNYQVIPQVEDSKRMDPKQLDNFYINTQYGKGPAVPLSSVVSLSYGTQPTTLEKFQQLKSATIGGWLCQVKPWDKHLPI